ncbi:hypothetical protein ACWTV9_19990 [Clostridioides difficile]
MKLKKAKFLLLSSVLTLMLATPVSFADTRETPKVVYSSNEITDYDILYDRAKNGISDLSEKKVVSNDTEEFSTTQLLKEKKYSDYTEQEYVTSSFTCAVPSKMTREASTSDKTYGVVAYTNTYYTVENKGAARYIKLTKLTGGWRIKDSQIKVTNKTYSAGISGTALNGGSTYKTTGTKSTTASTFSYTIPNWPAVFPFDGNACHINTNAKLTSGGSTWSLSHQESIN